MANYNNFKRAFEHYLNNVDMITKVVLDDLEDVGEITSKKSGGRKSINRGDRRRATASAKKRMKSLATYSVAEICNTGKVKNYGEKHYFKGAKAWSRKVRHEIFSEPMPEEPVVGELTIDDDNDFVWQSATIGEPIAEKVQDAWYLYNYDITMDAWLELVNIKKSIGKIREYNKILHSDKLADIADKLADNWSSKF